MFIFQGVKKQILFRVILFGSIYIGDTYIKNIKDYKKSNNYDFDKKLVLYEKQVKFCNNTYKVIIKHCESNK